MDKIIKIYKAEIKSIDDAKKRAVVTVSTDKEDRDGDVILPASIKQDLKYYKSQPVLLSSHNYYTLMSQIGKAHNIKATDDTIEADFEWFAGQVGPDGKTLNPEADWAWFLMKQGVAAFSIGFIGKEFDWIEKQDPDTKEKRITGRKFSRIELMEVSQVLIPSNRGAVQNMVDDDRIPVEAKEMCQLVLKAHQEGKIDFSKFAGNSQKKLQNKDGSPAGDTDDAMLSAHATRITALEKSMTEMQANHDAMAQDLKDLQSWQSSFNQTDDFIDPNGMGDGTDNGGKGKRHYSRTLLAMPKDKQKAAGKEASVDADIKAIKEAFKS